MMVVGDFLNVLMAFLGIDFLHFQLTNQPANMIQKSQTIIGI